MKTTSPGRALQIVAVAALLGAASLATVGTGTAVSTPTPHPPVTCPRTIDVASLREDAELALAGLTASTHADNRLPSSYESVQLRWTALPLPEGCIAMFRRGPGDADFPARPHTLLARNRTSGTTGKSTALASTATGWWRSAGRRADRRARSARRPRGTAKRSPSLGPSGKSGACSWRSA